MRTINNDIKAAIKKANLHQYEVADKLEIAETTLVRWLRYELTEERRNQITNAINELSK